MKYIMKILNSKSCYSCKIEKPFEEFFKNKIFKDGLHHKCKPCEKTRKNTEANIRKRKR